MSTASEKYRMAASRNVELAHLMKSHYLHGMAVKTASCIDMPQLEIQAINVMHRNVISSHPIRAHALLVFVHR